MRACAGSSDLGPRHAGIASHSRADKAAPTAPSPPGLGEMRSDSASRPRTSAKARTRPWFAAPPPARAKRGHDLPAADHRGHEIPRHRQAQTVGDLPDGRPFLLQVDHVRLGEYAAPAGDGCPRGAAAASRAKASTSRPSRAGLLLEEGARSGGALLVQAVVQQRERPRFDHHVAGRVAADLDRRLGVGKEERGRPE